eukprot:gene13641-15028_t
MTSTEPKLIEATLVERPEVIVVGGEVELTQIDPEL